MTQHTPEPLQERNWFEKLFDSSPQNRTELLAILKEAQDENVIDHHAYSMMEGSLSIANQQARDVFVPRTQVVAVFIDQTLDEFLPKLLESGHSRFPVFGANKEDIIGVLFAKDILKYLILHKDDPFELQRITRPAFFVPESKRLDVLLQDFRKSHNHLAIVVDEYGSMSGIVTIEDILEEIVGDIEDEFDPEEQPQITAIDDKTHHVDALTTIEDFNEHFHCHLSDEDVDTIGGLITQQLGYMPHKGDHVQIAPFEITVLEADERRAITLEVQTLN